jgi:hypothetical protein
MVKWYLIQVGAVTLTDSSDMSWKMLVRLSTYLLTVTAVIVTDELMSSDEMSPLRD